MLRSTIPEASALLSLIRVALVFSIAFTCTLLDSSAQTRRNPAIPSISSKNLIPNSSFELGADGWSTLGNPTAGGGDLCGLYGVLQAGNAFNGEFCLRIDLGPEKTPVTHSDYTLGASRSSTQSAPRAASLGWMDLSVGHTYLLSAYMRANKDGVPAELIFRFGGDVNTRFGSDTHAKRVTLTQEWARYSVAMVASRPDVYVALGPNLNETPDASATVWIDAVQLEAASDPRDVGPVPSDYAPREPVEVGIDSEHYGNLFDSKEPVRISVSASNTTPAPQTVEIHTQIEDYFGERWPSSVGRITVPEGGRSRTFLAPDLPGPGYYRAHVSWHVAGVVHKRTLKMSVVDTYPWKDSPFGLNHFPTTAEACLQLKKGGVTWARDWSLKWDSIEVSENRYDFAETDRQVDRILDLDANLLPLLPPQPSSRWASEAPEGDLSAVKRTAYAPSPEHRPKLNAFINKTVNRYKDRLSYWEFLNEPLWVPWYCLPSDGGYDVHSYIALLKDASAAMKAADPTCRVIGGLSIMASSALGDEFIQNGGLEHVDIYNLHPYPEGEQPEVFISSMERVLGAMDANGGRKPIWATEMGYWASDDKPWTPWAPPNPNHWSANRQQATEREASDFNTRQAIILLAHGVEKIFWHSGLEGEVNNGVNDLENPLLDPEATPQKFFAALAALARLLGPSPDYVAPFEKPKFVSEHSTKGVHGYAFDTKDGAAMIVWAPGRLNGGTSRDDGTIPLGESPIYLKTRSKTAVELSSACTLLYSAEGWALAVPDGVGVQTIVGAPLRPASRQLPQDDR